MKLVFIVSENMDADVFFTYYGNRFVRGRTVTCDKDKCFCYVQYKVMINNTFALT